MEKKEIHIQNDLKGFIASVEDRFKNVDKSVGVIRTEQKENKKQKDEKEKKKEEERKKLEEERKRKLEEGANDPTKKEILQVDP